VGPSSIVLALMASGLNGQSFAFKGYLPRDPGRRDKLWREMLEGLNRRRETQIFMEPPYRNAQAFGECLSRLPGDTALCVAVDLTLPDALVVTRSIEEWRELPAPSLQKRPCLFLVGH
jgi:16S rRNA (cytidine1402-2'-O)-methyltransferase